ncbi:DNA translocase FtsK [Deinococcus cellulosilyticus]|uniref:FtsK domain-containing protein n=1 Tax=Deinococcus cellulosilyticus (strain DSM 18568 / NBRC 106333 / KACC 11606 / 5516J-15) TaxID=1223518 RepID=A0A511N8L8_DEIC1|nr:DNA translocase FtsK [Deinococcus cellulosilyticus]GEM49185.1 hypothetical protein DC3_48200 [Deinococcus cellulosilyticus NBRC 106333 = KACC 11606]
MNTITRALVKAIEHQVVSAQSKARGFIKIEGFDDSTYLELLQALSSTGFQLGGKRIQVRTTSPVRGFERQAVEENRSATWYRNHVEEDEVLLLIMNVPTSDAQSLKNIFTIDEAALTSSKNDGGLRQLFEAAFTGHQLAPEDWALMTTFLSRLETLRKPQLRDLARFLTEVNDLLAQNPGLKLKKAITRALPHLGLFRCEGQSEVIGTAKQDRLLKSILQVASLGSEHIEPSKQKTYLELIEDNQFNFEDESASGGLTPQQKAETLRRFLAEPLHGEDLLRALQLDWDEVQFALSKRAKISKKDARKNLAEDIELALTGRDVRIESQSEALKNMLQDLMDGKTPQVEDIEQVLDDLADVLDRKILQALRKERGTRKREGRDFPIEVARCAMELLDPTDRTDGENLTLKISFKPEKGKKEPSRRALQAFRALYGNIHEALPAITWDLGALWDITPVWNEELDPKDPEPPRSELLFKVEVKGPGGEKGQTMDLVWVYEPDDVNATTHGQLLHIIEHQQQFIPTYTVPRTTGGQGIDLESPLKSLGNYASSGTSIDQPFVQEVLGKHYGMHNAGAVDLQDAMLHLLDQWKAFVGLTLQSGLRRINVYRLLEAYETLLSLSILHLSRHTLASRQAFPWLNRAWMVELRDHSGQLVMPFLHPLKLHWWVERNQQLHTLIWKLLDPHKPVEAVDFKGMREDLDRLHASASSPAVLAHLPEGRLNSEYLVSMQEHMGFELYSPLQGERLSRRSDTRVDAMMATRSLIKVIEDYLETYPFVRDGVDIYLLQCSNAALPGVLADELLKLSEKRKWNLKFNLTVHTLDNGVRLHQAVNEWIAEHDEETVPLSGSYFPAVNLRVVQGPLLDLVQGLTETDLAILADVLSEKGQKVEDLQDQDTEILALSGYAPQFASQPLPVNRDELDRQVQLTPRWKTALLLDFYRMQHLVHRKGGKLWGEGMDFQLRITLENWETELKQLHEHFNWVVCYDTTVDRYLLERGFPQAVQVIRYSLGLGPLKQHKMTVSSSRQVRDVVVRRLGSNLGHQLLSGFERGTLTQLAEAMVDYARNVSGDIVLRAAGPGAYLNEIIGLVTARFRIEQELAGLAEEIHLDTWLYLDDFRHWFRDKMPDLLHVRLHQTVDRQVKLSMRVVETKCVSTDHFDREARDAEVQVARGTERILQIFRPQKVHLDHAYWYNQLYQALAGNMEITGRELSLWEDFREALRTGRFELSVQGQTWIFCHNGPGNPKLAEFKTSKQDFETQLASTLGVTFTARHYSRTALREALREMAATRNIDIEEHLWERLERTPEVEPEPVEESAWEPDPLPIPVAVHEAVSTPSAPFRASETTVMVMPPPEVVKMEEVQDTPNPAQERLQVWLEEQARKLQRLLRDYNLGVFPVNPKEADVGAAIVRFKVRLRPGEDLAKLQKQAVNLQREMALPSIPFIDNVPSTHFIGIDIPRAEKETIPFLPLLETLPSGQPGTLPVVLGQKPDGQMVTADLATFPHLLVAGVTGSGKSVFLRNLLVCLTAKHTPEQLQLMIVDPKRTDFAMFGGLPHLMNEGKVLLDARVAQERLLALIHEEMPRRQDIIGKARVFNIQEFNRRFPEEALPMVVAVIDEYAQLLTVIPDKERKAFEQDLMSLAQVGRALGLHLILATQRPSTDVVTGVLKANLPTRVALKVTTSIDSRVILDQPGAENLVGHGDMLYLEASGKVTRLQAPLMSSEELEDFLSPMRRDL